MNSRVSGRGRAERAAVATETIPRAGWDSPGKCAAIWPSCGARRDTLLAPPPTVDHRASQMTMRPLRFEAPARRVPSVRVEVHLLEPLGQAEAGDPGDE